MDKKLVYFAHPKSHYDREIEADCIEFIWTTLGGGCGEDEVEIEIFNPNQLMVDRVYKEKREKVNSINTSDPFVPYDPFDFFRDLAKASDYVVMVSFLDGFIGSGTADEGLNAFESGIPVFLISFTHVDGYNIKSFQIVNDFDKLNILSREETHDRNVDGVL